VFPDQVGDPRIGHHVVGETPGPADLDVAAAGQAGQVGRDPALGQADVLDAEVELAVHVAAATEPDGEPEQAAAARQHGMNPRIGRQPPPPAARQTA